MMKKIFRNATSVTWLNEVSTIPGDSMSNVSSQSYSNRIGDVLDKTSIISIANLEGEIIHANRNFEKISGYTSAELVGRNYRILSSFYHPKAFWQGMKEKILKGITWHNEIKNRAKNGTYFWVDTFIVPMPDEDGNVREYMSFQNDITERKITDEQLINQWKITELAINTVEIGVWEWHVETKEFTCNEYMRKHFGWSNTQTKINGEDFIARLHPDDTQKLNLTRQQALSGQSNYQNEYRIVLDDGSIHHISTKGTVIRDVAGKPIKIIGTSLNITDLKRSGEELKRQQSLLNLAIEAGEIGVYRWKRDGKKAITNKYMDMHFGLPLQNLNFNDFWDFVHPQDKAVLEKAINDSFLEEKKFDVEYRVLLKDGTENHIAAKGNIIYDEDTKTKEMVGIALNITKQKELEATLRESEKKFRSAMHDSAIGMSLVSVDGKFLDVNRALLDILGYEKAELLAMDVQSITHPDDLAWELKYLQELVSGETEPCTIEKRYIHKDGSVIWGQLNGSLVKNDAGELLYFIAQIQDITLRKQMDVKLQEHNQKLEAANSELESFSYSVSHDLRAPLRIINGYVEILKEDFAATVGDEGKQVIDTIIYNANKMGHLIDDLLEFSRMNRKGIEKNLIEMDDMVDNIVLELTALEKDREIDVKVGRLHNVLADVQMIRQVWLNLIQNGIKYTRNKSIARIEIDSYKERGSTCFFIRDNGVGFNMKYVHKLFEVFQRLHSVSEFEGTGVGLAIVKRIIDRHGGRIWVDSKENEGTTFYFTIPDNQVNKS